MFLNLLFISFISLIIIIVTYLYRAIEHRRWLKTDNGSLQDTLRKLKNYPKDIRTLQQAAHLFYKTKDHQKAFEYYSNLIITKDPNMIDLLTPKDCFGVYLELGLSAYQINNLEEALINLKRARCIFPKASNIDLSKTLGLLLFQKDQLPSAVKELEIAYKLNAEDSSNNFYLGMSYSKLGDFKKGLRLLEPLKDKYCEDPLFLLALAQCLDKNEKTEQAIVYYRSIADNKIVGAMASSDLARLYLANNNTPEALAYFKKVPLLESPCGELSYASFYETARTYAKLGKLREACVPLQKLCDLNRNYRDAFMLLQNYREMTNNYNFYLLYYGDETERGQIVRKLLQKLIPSVRRVLSEHYTANTIELTVSTMNLNQEHNCYVRIDLLNKSVPLSQVHEILNRGREFACRKYMLISTNNFDITVKSFCQVRSIELIEGWELRGKLLEIS